MLTKSFLRFLFNSLSLPGIRLPGDRDEQLVKHCIFAVSGAFSTGGNGKGGTGGTVLRIAGAIEPE
jgi:hypothetical protein